MPTKFMLNYLQERVPEFEHHSHTSLAFLLSNARIIDLHSREGNQGNTLVQHHKSHRIDDFRKLGFYMLLKGRCELVFEVTKQRKLDQVDSSMEGNDANEAAMYR